MENNKITCATIRHEGFYKGQIPIVVLYFKPEDRERIVGILKRFYGSDWGMVYGDLIPPTVVPPPVHKVENYLLFVIPVAGTPDMEVPEILDFRTMIKNNPISFPLSYEDYHGSTIQEFFENQEIKPFPIKLPLVCSAPNMEEILNKEESESPSPTAEWSSKTEQTLTLLAELTDDPKPLSKKHLIKLKDKIIAEYKEQLKEVVTQTTVLQNDLIEMELELSRLKLELTTIQSELLDNETKQVEP